MARRSSSAGSGNGGPGIETGEPRTEEHTDRINALIQKMVEAVGVEIAAGRRPSHHDSRWRSEDGKIGFTDGPYIESKEILGGPARNRE